MTTFTTWDPDQLVNVALSGSNLVATATSTNAQVRAADYRTSSKLYFEVTLDASGGNGGTRVGLASTGADLITTNPSAAIGFIYDGQTGNFNVTGGGSGSGLGAGASVTLCFAIDFTNKKGWVRVNGGTWNHDAAANPATNTNGLDLTVLLPGDGLQPFFCTQTNGAVATANYGASAFGQTIPSGFTGWDVSGSSCLFTNAGGTGNRTSTITVTTTMTFAGTFNHIVNGNLTENNMFFGSNSPGVIMKFDFGSTKIVDMWRFYMDTDNLQGTWQVAGSPDDVTYTSIANAAILKGGATGSPSVYFLAGNTTGYRYYRWTLTSGSTNGGPWINEIEFRISDPPTVHGSLIVTEAPDIFAGVGSVLGGSWHSTEAKDTFHAVSAPGGAWASIEAKDIWSGAGYPKLTAVWASTETADIAGMLGGVAVPLAIDGQVSGGAFDPTSSAPVSSASVTLTTTKPNDVIVVAVFVGGFWHAGPVTSITDSVGLVWKRRNQRYILGESGSTKGSSQEIWWAVAPSPLSAAVITVNTAPSGFINIEACGISGANTSAPWDKHTGAGWYADNQGSIADFFDNVQTPVTFVYTQASKTLVLEYYATNKGFSGGNGPVSAPFTYDGVVTQTEHIGWSGSLAMAHSTFNSPQVGLPFAFGPPAEFGNAYSVMQDVIVSATDTGTADAVRWFFDGVGIQTIVALSGTSNSASAALTTYNSGSIACVAVLIEGSGVSGIPFVDHVSDSGNHSGWTRRSRVQDALGTSVLEVWYVPMDAFDGTINVVTGNTGPGDIIGFVAFAVNGPSVFFRGELWDGDPSLPATNSSETPVRQTAGPFNTINLNVLEINFGANISQPLIGFNTLPWLFLPAPASLDSATPSFNIAIQFKFSGPEVAGDTAVFSTSPEPSHWLMIADAMPVGLPTPPQGVWGSTETKDRTGHTLDYTAIGIASPGGFVGFVPNHATMAAVETKDRNTNSGAFLPLFNSSGWIAAVPAFAAWASTESKDIASWHAWVLGEPLVARWRSQEIDDRMGASNRSTVTAVMAAQEAGDRHSGTAFLIPKAVPAPPRKRNVVIVT